MSEPAIQLTGAVLPIRREAPPFDFTARAGENWMLVGPLGGGRTTLLKVLATLIRLNRGGYRVNGVEVGDFAAEEVFAEDIEDSGWSVGNGNKAVSPSASSAQRS